MRYHAGAWERERAWEREKKRYSYSKGDPFDLSVPTGQYVNATITLHKVVSGNYSTKPVDESEFDQ
jgi:hypothetical protein